MLAGAAGREHQEGRARSTTSHGGDGVTMDAYARPPRRIELGATYGDLVSGGLLERTAWRCGQSVEEVDRVVEALLVELVAVLHGGGRVELGRLGGPTAERPPR